MRTPCIFMTETKPITPGPDTGRGRISLVRGHCNSCLGKPLVHEGTTAIPMTVEGHQGKSRNSKGASRQTMHLLSFDKLHLLKG